MARARLQEGDSLAGYRIVRLIGKGGMGVVYLARHPRLPRNVALKVLTATDDEEFRERFKREAELVSRLDHPSIVTVYDRGVEDTSPWMSMQYVPGTDAGKELRSGPFEVARAAQVVRRVARALDHAHRTGLLHRDVKPSNILLAREEDPDTDEPRDRVMLTDFGIATVYDDPDVRTLTRTGMILATVDYASPEQLQGISMNGAADQYSLACTAYMLLTGRAPFVGAGPVEIMQQHLRDEVPGISTLRETLPSTLDPVFRRALSKKPQDRYPTCNAFARALSEAVGQRPSKAVSKGTSPASQGALTPRSPAYGASQRVTYDPHSTVVEPRRPQRDPHRMVQDASRSRWAPRTDPQETAHEAPSSGFGLHKTIPSSEGVAAPHEATYAAAGSSSGFTGPTPVEVRPSRRRRRVLVAGGIAAVAVVALGVWGLTFLGGGDDSADETGPTSGPTATSTPTPTATTSAPPGDGSKDRPFAHGEVAKTGNWQISLGVTDSDARDMLSDPSSVGADKDVLLVEATMRYTGAGTGTPLLSLAYTYVAPDGTEVTGWETSCTGVPNSIERVAPIRSNSSATGNLCVVVDKGQSGGSWKLKDQLGLNNESVYISAGSQQ